MTHFEPPDTWLSLLRWRAAITMLVWAIQLAPAGGARDALVDLLLAWMDECKRQWRIRYGGDS